MGISFLPKHFRIGNAEVPFLHQVGIRWEGRKIWKKKRKNPCKSTSCKTLCLFNTFQFANAYANGEGMKHYVNMVQEPEFAARDKGYTFVSHQQEVGAGYFDDVTTVIQGGSSSVKALTGSTEEEQFH